MHNHQIKRRILLAVERILNDALPSEPSEEADRADAETEETTAATALDPDVDAGYTALRKDYSDLWRNG